MQKKSFFCERLTTEELKDVVGMVEEGSRGGTDAGGPSSGGAGACVCACWGDSTRGGTDAGGPSSGGAGACVCACWGHWEN